MIKINGKEYTIKPTIRAMVIFESIIGKPFDSTLTTHNIVYFYSVVMANSKDAGLTLEEFYDAIDADENLIPSIGEEIKRHNLPLNEESEEGGTGTKK